MNRAAKSTATARIRLRAALAAATETIDRLAAENDQLKATQLNLEEGLGRCADRYDFAPIGLLTLDAAGIIREANLKAASMLGIEGIEVTTSGLTVKRREPGIPGWVGSLRGSTSARCTRDRRSGTGCWIRSCAKGCGAETSVSASSTTWSRGTCGR